MSMLMEENIYDIDWYSVYKSYKQLDISSVYWKWFFFEVSKCASIFGITESAPNVKTSESTHIFKTSDNDPNFETSEDNPFFKRPKWSYF